MALIELRKVSKVYDLGETQVNALRDVSLDIDAGEYLALVGPSGSGKSTLMNTLGCLDRPTSGSYRLGGEEVATLSATERARIRNREVGFVFQNFNLLPRTSALENVELPLLYGGSVPRRQRRQRAVQLLDQVGLADRINSHPSQLSGGQQQRVAVARALVNGPSILMADEPTGNLDSRTSGEVMDLFETLNRESGITIVVVTHDHSVARRSGRVVVLRDGVVTDDTTRVDDAIEGLHAFA